MKFINDHDFHIHSYLSYCSNDKEQNNKTILKYAEDNGFSKICLTNHFWDTKVSSLEGFYDGQNYKHLCEALPLPQSENVHFYFGCECDLNKDLVLGISPESFNDFDLVLIPTTHLHMKDNIDEMDCTIEGRANVFVNRLDKLLSMDLQFEKVGIAHLTCNLIDNSDWQNHMKVLDLIDDKTYEELFTKVHKNGAGIELNFNYSRYAPEDIERNLRPYRIAKKCGCKFYMGSDSHHPSQLDKAKDNFQSIIDALNLEESDKFKPFK